MYPLPPATVLHCSVLYISHDPCVRQVNTPVKLQTDEQDATIYAGDYLIGDLNGVVCLPKDLAEKAIALMSPQVEADQKIAADVQKGMTFTEASKKHRSGLLKP